MQPDTFDKLSDQGKIDFLHDLDVELGLGLANTLLDIVTDRSQDMVLRVECARTLGLYLGDYDDTHIRQRLLNLVWDDDDETVESHALMALASLDVGPEEISECLRIVRSELSTVVRHAAFSLIAPTSDSLWNSRFSEKSRCRRHAAAALRALTDDDEFGSYATQAMRRLASD